MISFFVYSQNLSLHVDSLVISSLPWSLTPGMFGRSDEDIRGNRTIVVKDSLAISEFITCLGDGLNADDGSDYYIDPRVLVDIYCGSSFLSISLDRDHLCRYKNRKTVQNNGPLFRWITKYVPPPKER